MIPSFERESAWKEAAVAHLIDGHAYRHTAEIKRTKSHAASENQTRGNQREIRVRNQCKSLLLTRPTSITFTSICTRLLANAKFWLGLTLQELFLSKGKGVLQFSCATTDIKPFTIWHVQVGISLLACSGCKQFTMQFLTCYSLESRSSLVCILQNETVTQLYTHLDTHLYTHLYSHLYTHLYTHLYSHLSSEAV